MSFSGKIKRKNVKNLHVNVPLKDLKCFLDTEVIVEHKVLANTTNTEAQDNLICFYFLA